MSTENEPNPYCTELRLDDRQSRDLILSALSNRHSVAFNPSEVVYDQNKGLSIRVASGNYGGGVVYGYSFDPESQQIPISKEMQSLLWKNFFKQTEVSINQSKKGNLYTKVSFEGSAPELVEGLDYTMSFTKLEPRKSEDLLVAVLSDQRNAPAKYKPNYSIKNPRGSDPYFLIEKDGKPVLHSKKEVETLIAETLKDKHQIAGVIDVSTDWMKGFGSIKPIFNVATYPTPSDKRQVAELVTSLGVDTVAKTEPSSRFSKLTKKLNWQL